MAQVLTGSPTITRLSPALGAEVRGLDVSRPLDAAMLARVRDAFQEHHLLCFRDQRLTDDQLTAFSLQFGPLEAFPEKDKTKGRRPRRPAPASEPAARRRQRPTRGTGARGRRRCG